MSSQYGLEALHSLIPGDPCSWFCSWSKHSANVWNEVLGIPQAINIGAFFLSQGRNPSGAHTRHLLPGQDFALPSSAFPFALALKELKHPKWIISTPGDCQPSQAALAVRPCRGTSTLQHVLKHPPASPRCSGVRVGVRAHRSVISMECDIHEMCCSCNASLCPWCPCECPDLFCISSTSWLRRCPLAEYPTF